MIKLENKPYQLEFCELGDTDLFTKTFTRLEQAKKYQQELISKHWESSGYYTQISRIIEVRRKEPNEEVQTKKFQEVKMK